MSPFIPLDFPAGFGGTDLYSANAANTGGAAKVAECDAQEKWVPLPTAYVCFAAGSRADWTGLVLQLVKPPLG